MGGVDDDQVDARLGDRLRNGMNQTLKTRGVRGCVYGASSIFRIHVGADAHELGLDNWTDERRAPVSGHPRDTPASRTSLQMDAARLDRGMGPLGAALHLAQLAARSSAAPIYLEVGEEGTARRSYDINLYKANLTLAEIEPVLLEAAARYALPQERFAAFYSQLRQRPFGHLSGGFARDGSDFLTVYYETQPL